MPIAMARHILVKTEAEAAELKKRLAAGEPFDVLAKKHSTCPSKKRGGDLGEVKPGQMVRAIDQIIFKKPLKQIHGPVKTQFGYHLVQVFSATELAPSVQLSDHTASHTCAATAQWFGLVSVVVTPSVDHQCPTFKLIQGLQTGSQHRRLSVAIFVHIQCWQITQMPFPIRAQVLA